MKKFTTVKTIATPLAKVNVDTDQIIPKQFLKSIKSTGFDGCLFYNWRFLPDGTPNPDFVLNDPRYDGSKILVASDNFGCGSSREHAVWALRDYGFDVVVSSSFADIFYNNCFKNGILPVTLPADIVRQMQQTCDIVEVSLESQTITVSGKPVSFEIDSYKKRILLEGLSDIDITLEYTAEIESFEKRTRIPSVL